MQQQLLPQQVHHSSGSGTPNVVAVSSGQPVGKIVHYAQVPTNVSQIPRRPLLLQVFVIFLNGMYLVLLYNKF